MKKKSNPNEYVSLSKAGSLCNYSQEYLSLRARQGKLKAVKIGRNWVTTQEWLEEYIRQVKKEEIKAIPAAKEEKAKVEKPKIVGKPKIRERVPLTDFYRVLRTGFATKLEQSLEKTVGQPIDIGLALFDKIAHPVLLLARGIKNITLLAGQIACQKLFQPKSALTTVFITLLIISSILLVSPRAQTPLIYWSAKSAQFLVTASEKLSNSISKQGDHLIQFAQEAPSRVKKDILWPTLGIIKSIGTISQKTIYYSTRQMIQSPQKIVTFYQSVGQRNEEAKLVAKLKIRQLIQAIPGLMTASFEVVADNLRATPAKIDLTLVKMGRSFELLADNSIKALHLVPKKIGTLIGQFQEKQVRFTAWLRKSPQYVSQAFARLTDIPLVTLSDTIPDALSRLSDTAKNLSQKLIICLKKTNFVFYSSFGKGSAGFFETVTYINQEISQGWDEFIQSVPQLPQETKLAFGKIKSKLGDAYLKLVQFFEGRDETPLVYAPKDVVEDIDELEESIIEDIQVRFNDFRGDLGISRQEKEKEGVIVVPLEEDEEQTKQRVKELSEAFSDEVAVKPDETGKAGLIQPIFREERLQKYLYMMVPVKEVEAREN